MSEPSALTNATFNRLARTALNNPSTSARKEALLELRKLDHPGVVELLQKVIAQDKDAEVVDLAQNLLRKQEIQGMIERGSFDEAVETAPDPFDNSASMSDDLELTEYQEKAKTPTLGQIWAGEDRWTCRFCDTENTGGNYCDSCGAERGGTRTESDEKPKRAEKVKRKVKTDEVLDIGDVFLLQPANAAFMLGQRTIASTFSGISFGCVGLFLLPFLAIGIFVIVMAGVEWRNYTLLNTTGVVVRGEYTGKYIDEDDDDGGVSYHARYEYRVNDILYQGEHSIGQDIYNRVEQGAGVNIIYAPSDPSVSRIEGEQGIENALFFTFFALFWNLISWGMFLGMVISRRRDRILSREGQMVRGERRGISTRRDSDGDLQFTAEYSFVPPDGGDVIFRKQTAQRNDLKNGTLPDKGTPVMVLYKDRKHFKML